MYDWALCEHVQRAGQDVVFASCPEFEYSSMSRTFSAELILAGYRSRKLSPLRRTAGYFMANLRLLRMFVKAKPEVVHYQFMFFPPIDIISLLIMRGRAKLFFTAHDVRVTTDARAKRLLLRTCMNLFHGIVVHSDEARTALSEYLPEFKGKMETIPHGNYFPLLQRHGRSRSREELRRIYGIPGAAKVVLFLGSILDYKGLDILIEGFSASHKIDPTLHLVIAGSTRGETFDKYDALIESNGIRGATTKNIKYLSEEEVLDMIKLADLMVLPYRVCFTPGVAHLALSCGIPVIATKTGAFPSVISDGVTGYLVEGTNPEDWAEKIVEVLGNPEELRKVSSQGRSLMTNKHSWESVARKTIQLYEGDHRVIVEGGPGMSTTSPMEPVESCLELEPQERATRVSASTR